jgi:dihydroorotase
MKTKGLLIKGGYVFVEKNPLIADLLVENSVITKIEKDIKIDGSFEILDARDCVVAPSLVDLHTHIREPGCPEAESYYTGSLAAIAGGFGHVTVMPNTQPAIDNVEILDELMNAAKEMPVNFLFTCAITKERKGQALVDMAELSQKGAVFFTDDGNCLENANIMNTAMTYSKGFGAMIAQHPEDTSLSGTGQINEGKYCAYLGLKPIPEASEEVIVARDLILAKYTGARYHVQHVSTQGALESIRAAKAQKLAVSCEVTPHHLVLDDSYLMAFDSNFKMKPPLRSMSDKKALIKALLDGTIDAIATDHAPHLNSQKKQPFIDAPFGVIGLQTTLGASIKSVWSPDFENESVCPKEVLRVIEALTYSPAKILGLKSHKIAEGHPANVSVIDWKKKWMIKESDIYSGAKNSCFYDIELIGAPRHVVINGKALMIDGIRDETL